jgi:hypothetical protein
MSSLRTHRILKPGRLTTPYRSNDPGRTEWLFLIVLMPENVIALRTEFFGLFFPIPVQNTGVKQGGRPVIMDL